MNRIEKPFSELDVNAVDLESSQWTWSRGGTPYSNYEYGISFIDDNLNETRYKLPEFMNKMLAQMTKYGSDDAKRKIQAALSI